MKKVKKKFAFTLAEAMIAMSIIGIVAAMTLKILKTSYDKDLINKWKKTYSTIQQAQNAMKADNEEFKTPTAGSSNKAYNSSLLFRYLKFSKTCPSNCTSEGCWYSAAVFNSAYYYFSNPGGILADGTLISVYGWIMFVDVNGFKKPNKYGKDIFV